MSKYREKLIDTLFKTFEDDKEAIKRNLLEIMNYVWLEATDEYNKIKMTIEIERRCEENEDIKKETI